MIPVKICGITNLDDAQYAVQSGATALGFIFHPLSPRYIDPARVRVIVDQLPAHVITVGVFVNRDTDTIENVIDQAALDMVQLSGDEPASIINSIGFPTIKVFHVGPNFDMQLVIPYSADTIMFDAKSSVAYGGTGRVFDWSLIGGTNRHTPLILAGGLNPDNVIDAINAAKPDAIDLSTGLEIKPGRKDFRKIDELFHKLRETKATHAKPFRKS